MAQKPQNSDTVEVVMPRDTEHTKISTVHGVRLPDGKHEWGTFTKSGLAYFYEALADEGHKNHTWTKTAWEELLEAKATAASIDLVDYIEAHKLVKRTVILITTAPEEV